MCLGRTRGQVALGAHLGQQQQAAPLGQAHLLQALDDARARHLRGVQSRHSGLRTPSALPVRIAAAVLFQLLHTCGLQARRRAQLLRCRRASVMGLQARRVLDCSSGPGRAPGAH